MNATNSLPGDSTDRVLRSLARKAGGLSGADVERLVRQARQKARRQRRGVEWADLAAFLEDSKPTRPEQMRLRTAIHEAAHAVARIHMDLGEITIITIDAAGGGYVESLFPEFFEGTEERLTGLLITMLSGRAAEAEVFGSMTAGSGGGSDISDLARATRLAVQMETVFGFSPKSPLLYRSIEGSPSMLHIDRELAARINTRLESAYAAARKFVAQHLDAIRFVSDTLMQSGTLEGEELAATVSRVKEFLADPPDPAGEDSQQLDGTEGQAEGESLSSAQSGASHPGSGGGHAV